MIVMTQHSWCLQRGRMSEERLLASLCSACELPPPLYDLEVTGGDKVTVCCVVGRSEIFLFLYGDDLCPQSRIRLQCCLIG